ncbi:hypothetical protein MED222_06435 [Vibrio sp. MED222]|nr:hypothetical protein MED222_06435 [Vibrio sp. MED222]
MARALWCVHANRDAHFENQDPPTRYLLPQQLCCEGSAGLHR